MDRLYGSSFNTLFNQTVHGFSFGFFWEIKMVDKITVTLNPCKELPISIVYRSNYSFQLYPFAQMESNWVI